MTAAAGIEHLLDVERRRTVLEIAELTDELQAIAATAGTGNEHNPDGATIPYERRRVSALLERAKLRLGEIDDAIARLGDATFGRCQNCGGAIGSERLAAVPSTRVCLRCAAAGTAGP